MPVIKTHLNAIEVEAKVSKSHLMGCQLSCCTALGFTSSFGIFYTKSINISNVITAYVFMYSNIYFNHFLARMCMEIIMKKKPNQETLLKSIVSRQKGAVVSKKDFFRSLSLLRQLYDKTNTSIIFKIYQNAA